MKMVKSLLLGSAAGLVAVAGAQAADLPVKAKPVEYVKVCSLYGAGFYYMPGTDICIKVGGYVRAQAYYNQGSSGTPGNLYSSAGFDNRVASNNFEYRTRGVLTLDTRQQTEYGTLRTYALIGFQHDGGNNLGQPQTGVTGTGGTNGLYATRGFIQIAGFTFGKAQSFYDIFSQPAISYFSLPGGDTGDPGMMLMAYTAQFGNGFTGTVSLEDPRRGTLANATPNGTGAVYPWLNNAAAAFTQQWGGLTSNGNYPGNLYGEENVPDIVGVLRLDQGWGALQLMAAAHEVTASYYDSTSTASGHPSDKWGFAVGFGGIIKADVISPGDLFQFQVNYAEGATRYIDFTPYGSGDPQIFNGGTFGEVLQTDGVYAFGNGIQLTTAFGAIASYDHVWNQKWKTDLYAGYDDMSYNATAKALIAGVTCVNPGKATNIAYVAGCNPNGNHWFVGSRTQFNINASTYLGLDVMYSKIDTSFAGNAQVFTGVAPITQNSALQVKDEDMVSVTFRVHRDFLP